MSDEHAWKFKRVLDDARARNEANTADALRQALAAVIVAFDRGLEHGSWMTNLTHKIAAARKLLEESK